MANLQELLGDQIIENRTDQAAEAYEQIPINKLEGKVIGLYFSCVSFVLFIDQLL